MRRLITVAFASCVLLQSAFCEEFEKKSMVLEITEDFQPGSCSKIGTEAGHCAHDVYLAAYLQALVDAQFPKNGSAISVRHGQAVVTNLPEDQELRTSLKIYLTHLISQSQPALNNFLAQAEPIPENLPIVPQEVEGIWLPQSTVLYPTIIANPRALMFSVGPRFGDCLAKHVATAVSFGDQFPIYRWANFWDGDLQFEVEAGVFALFSMAMDSAPLLNADYYAGLPLSYAYGKWANRLRLYHISSHVGDEYFTRVACKDFKRKNLSFEAIDFYTSYQLDEAVRLFGGVGGIVHSDSEMILKPLYAEYGFEARTLRHNFSQLFGQPFLSVSIKNTQDHNYRFETNYALGYEWGKIQGIGRKIRLFAEYHNGFCPEGQFMKQRDQYFGIRLGYGF